MTTKPHGTGLGLAICRGIADAHHARLGRPEQRGAARLLVHRRVPRPVGPPDPHRSVKTVLLVSASDSLRTRLLRGLEYTHSVFTASSDDEALRTLRVTEIELIVKEIAGPSRDLAAFIGACGICARPRW